MGVYYDYDRAIIALRLHILKALKAMQKQYMAEARQTMTPEASRELTAGEVKFLSGLMFLEVIGGPHVVMNEWGTGSLVDTTNPALLNYIRSGMFYHPRLSAKPPFAILGRPKGYYLNIFGKRVRSSGRAQNVNLEEMARQGKIKNNPERFLPKPAMRSMQQTMRWFRFKKASILADALATFPWGDFIVATKD